MDDDPADEDSNKQINQLFFKAKVLYLKPFFYPRP